MQVQREKAELAVILAHLEAAYPDVEIVPAKLVEKLDLSDAKYETASKEKILKDFTGKQLV